MYQVFLLSFEKILEFFKNCVGPSFTFLTLFKYIKVLKPLPHLDHCEILGCQLGNFLFLKV